MDVQKLIEAAEHCIKDDDCTGCVFEELPKCPLHSQADSNVLTLKSHYDQKLSLLREDIKLQRMMLGQHKEVVDHYRVLLSSERSKVIAEVRGWVEDEENIYGDAMGNPVLCKHEMLEKLDSMDRGDGE